VEVRAGVAVFGPESSTVAGFTRAMDASAGGFDSSPCYAAAAESYRSGGGLMRDVGPASARRFTASLRARRRDAVGRL